jgi:hypothetical protein
VASALELVQEMTAAYARGGVEATLPYLDDQLVFFPSAPTDGPVVRGRDGYAAHHRRLAGAGTSLEVVQDRFEDLGEGRVLIGGALRLIGRDGTQERPMWWLMIVQDDRVVSIAAHAHRDEALRSVGAA